MINTYINKVYCLIDATDETIMTCFRDMYQLNIEVLFAVID